MLEIRLHLFNRDERAMFAMFWEAIEARRASIHAANSNTSENKTSAIQDAQVSLTMNTPVVAAAADVVGKTTTEQPATKESVTKAFRAFASDKGLPEARKLLDTFGLATLSDITPDKFEAFAAMLRR